MLFLLVYADQLAIGNTYDAPDEVSSCGQRDVMTFARV
jgi:hypothetical protein